MGAGTDVDAQVEPPEQGAVKCVGVKKGVAGVTALGNVLGIRRIPFDDELISPVAVDVADAHVVGRVGVGLPRRGDPVSRFPQRKVVKRFKPRRDRSAAPALLAPDDGGHAVLGRAGARRVVVVGAAGDRRDGPAVAVDAEVRPRHSAVAVPGHLLAEQPPAQEHALAGGGGDQPAVEALHPWPVPPRGRRVGGHVGGNGHRRGAEQGGHGGGECATDAGAAHGTGSSRPGKGLNRYKQTGRYWRVTPLSRAGHGQMSPCRTYRRLIAENLFTLPSNVDRVNVRR